MRGRLIRAIGCWLIGFTAACVVILLAPVLARNGVAAAQRDRGKQAQPKGPPKKTLKASGTIKGIRPGLLQVVTGEGDQWILRVAARQQDIYVRAKADTGFLQKGRYVQFVGQFNNRGQAQSPIRAIEIFTPRKNAKFGVFPDRGTARGKEGEPPREEVVDPFGDLTPDVKTDTPVTSARYQIIGRISDVKKEWMVVLAGRTKVNAEIAQDAEVLLDVADLGLARPQDRLDFEGYYYPYPKGWAFATKLTVTSAEPLASKRSAARADEPPAPYDPLRPDG